MRASKRVGTGVYTDLREPTKSHNGAEPVAGPSNEGTRDLVQTEDGDVRVVGRRDEDEEGERVFVHEIQPEDADLDSNLKRATVFLDPWRSGDGMVGTGRVLRGEWGRPVAERVVDLVPLSVTTAEWILSRKRRRNLGDFVHSWNRHILNPDLVADAMQGIGLDNNLPIDNDIVQAEQ